MPLGDSNAGAPNPALLQFLFSRQDARRKEARQQQLDQAAAQAAAMKAAREDRKEEREIALFNQTFRDNQIKAHLNLADRGVAASEAAESSIAAIPGQNFTRDIIDPNLQGESLVGIDGTTIRTPGFAEVIAGLGLPAAKQAYAADPNQVQSAQEEAFRSFNRQIEGRPSVGPEEMLQDILSQQGADRIARQRDVVAGQEEEKFTARLGAGQGVREIGAFRIEIDRLRGAVAGAHPGSKQEKKLQDDLDAMAAGLMRKVHAGVAGSVFEAKKQLLDDFRLTQQADGLLQDVDSVIAAAEKNPNFLGYQGKAAGLEQFFVDAGVDVDAIFRDQVAGFFGDPKIDEVVKGEVRKGLGGLLGDGDEVIAQRITDVGLLSKRISFMLVRMSNPSRFAQAQVETFNQYTDVHKGTAAQALRRLRAVRGSLRRSADQTSDRVSFYNNALGLGIDDVLRTAEGQSIIRQGRGSLPGFEAPDISPADFIDMTPAEKRNHIQERRRESGR